MKRRDFLTSAATSAASAIAVSAMVGFPTSRIGAAEMNFRSDPLKQPPLPYKMNALAPFLSEEQMQFHYGKHHAGYFKNLNVLLEGKPEANRSLEEIVVHSDGSLFNNAAQAWNHSFFWNCMSPDTGKGKEPVGPLAAAIARDFGDYSRFRTHFVKAASTLFGSGWVWLAKNSDGKLEILSTSNADTPLKIGKRPLLTLDVWEHAYYIDYRNERIKFVEGFMERINWPFVESLF